MKQFPWKYTNIVTKAMQLRFWLICPELECSNVFMCPQFLDFVSFANIPVLETFQKA
jgi:hypothetical protein